MTEPPPYGLLRIKKGDPDHVVIVLHGIRQTRDDLAAPFGEALAAVSSATLFVHGYDHTRGIVENGNELATILATELDAPRIDLVGYSMGGLVARLAASDRVNETLHTVVTLATPNLGSLSNAELETLGQIGRNVFEFFSPIWPRAAGLTDLTRASSIMADRREKMMAVEQSLGRLRYASIRALFYNDQRQNTELGPSVTISGLQAFLYLANMKRKFLKMPRSHDGIVTEESNNITRNDNQIWPEVRLAKDQNGAPARLHVALDSCRKHDHSSILSDADVARLVWAVLDCPNWLDVERHDPVLVDRVSAR